MVPPSRKVGLTVKHSSMLFMIIALISALGQDAATPPTIKGHALGENIKDYIAKVQGGSDQLSRCRSAVSEPKSARKLKVNLAECRALAGAIDSGSRLKMRVADSESQGAAMFVTFEDATLIKMDLDIGELKYCAQCKPTPYEQVVYELTQKFGTPSSKSDFITQNGFGAIFPHRMTTWKTPLAFAHAYEANANVDGPETYVTVETPEEHKREEAQSANHPNALD